MEHSDDQEQYPSSSAVTQHNIHPNPNKKTTPQLRNWLDLPEGALSLVFEKLGQFDIICKAQQVCTAWRNLSKQPHFFRVIELSNPSKRSRTIDITKVQKEIVHRSGGQLVSLSYCVMQSHNTEVLEYAFGKPNFLNSLESLKLYYANVDWVIKTIANAKLPSLERLTLTLRAAYNHHTTEDVMVEIGKSCSRLKYFCWYRIRAHGVRQDDCNDYEDNEVLAIAEHMPQLRELCLQKNVVTDNGLRALFNECPHLEHLDLECCEYLTDLSEELLNKCRKRINTFSPPKHRYSRFDQLYTPTIPCYRVPYEDEVFPFAIPKYRPDS